LYGRCVGESRSWRRIISTEPVRGKRRWSQALTSENIALKTCSTLGIGGRDRRSSTAQLCTDTCGQWVKKMDQDVSLERAAFYFS
jgi:hypothetical protein